MKAFSKFLLALCLFSMSSLMCSAERLLADLSDVKDVKCVYVSNTMIQLLGKVGLSNLDGVGSYSSLMNDIKSIEIVSVEGKSKVKKRTKTINKFVKKMKNVNVVISNTTENKKSNGLKIMEHYNSLSGETDGLIVYVKRETSIYLIHLEGTINPASFVNFQ